MFIGSKFVTASALAVFAVNLCISFAFANKINLSKEIGEKLYLGIVGDTDRFLHDYTTNETIELASKLLNMSNINFTDLYSSLYSYLLSLVNNITGISKFFISFIFFINF